MCSMCGKTHTDKSSKQWQNVLHCHSCFTWTLIISKCLGRFSSIKVTGKAETELTASVLKKKRSKTHKRLKERFLIDETGQNVHIFEEVLFFKLRTTVQLQKTVKPTYLVSVWCWEAGGRKRGLPRKFAKIKATGCQFRFILSVILKSNVLPVISTYLLWMIVFTVRCSRLWKTVMKNAVKFCTRLIEWSALMASHVHFVQGFAGVERICGRYSVCRAVFLHVASFSMC